MTKGWIIPPPTEPKKSRAEFTKEREDKVRWLINEDILRSEPIRTAMLKVAREDFLPARYRDYAYLELPLPLPGERATVSCPHSYPLFYEPLGLDAGHTFLEIGLGSGYGAALAREIVGSKGLVVTMDIDPMTYEFGKANLERAGYTDILVVQGDGGLGYPDRAPYDRICITAACSEIPAPLVEQLKMGGRLIAPVEQQGVQNLTLVEKTSRQITRQIICEVLYIPLRGEYGPKATSSHLQ